MVVDGGYCFRANNTTTVFLLVALLSYLVIRLSHFTTCRFFRHYITLLVCNLFIGTGPSAPARVLTLQAARKITRINELDIGLDDGVGVIRNRLLTRCSGFVYLNR